MSAELNSRVDCYLDMSLGMSDANLARGSVTIKREKIFCEEGVALIRRFDDLCKGHTLCSVDAKVTTVDPTSTYRKTTVLNNEVAGLAADRIERLYKGKQ